MMFKDESPDDLFLSCSQNPRGNEEMLGRPVGGAADNPSYEPTKESLRLED